MLKKLLAPFASLKLTIVLIAMAIILVYAGTWAQVDTGIWTVQKRYFHSLWVWIDFQTLLPRPQPGQPVIPGGFPFLGGYALGGLMLVNLLAAHLTRFKFALKRSGIILIHAGLILLLVGEMLTSVLAVESQMMIDEGATAVYSYDTRHSELAVMDPNGSVDKDVVIAFPESRLQPGQTLRHSLVPFEIKIDEYYANSQILGPMQAKPGVTAQATAGFGRRIAVEPLSQSAGVEGAVDMPSAYVTLSAGGKDLGKYLLSLFFDGGQEVRVGDKTYLISLRFRRYYKPYSMRLIKFSHDKYLGTETPKNFSSRIQLVEPSAGVDREVLIRMNEPLRYAGETYYQASFKPGDKTTILQVVRNPAWTMPYIACVIGAVGMLIHFGIMLIGSLSKRSKRAATVAAIAKSTKASRQATSQIDPERLSIWGRIFPFAVGLAGLVLVFAMFGRTMDTPKPDAFNYLGFGNLPLTFDGRVLPFDTLARTSLQVIAGRETTRIGSETAPAEQWKSIPYSDWKSVPATRWLLDVFSGTDRADEYRIFRVDNPELLGLLGLDQDRNPRLYAYREIIASQDKLLEQISRVEQIENKKRGLFERKVAELYDHLRLYVRLSQLETLYLMPPLSPAEQWQAIGPYLPTAGQPSVQRNAASDLLLGAIGSYNRGNVDGFNANVAQYRALLADRLPTDVSKGEFEAFFNRFDPFLQAQILYVLVFVLGCCAWLGWTKPLGRAAFVLLLICLALHTFGLAARIYISGRPPVTNLYSSAVFIAWAGVVLAVGLELYFRNTIATVTSAAMGFTSLLIAHHLAGDGDTMKQLQAVLDTNFWLATHVVAITLGYSATFLAGVLAIAYILLGLFTRVLTADKPGRSVEESPAKLLPRMVYAILCFAILFSFVGTVLGGIWADQSWGRFWGWDPKENGAILIVLWNALTLHARWAGLVRARGVMILSVFGNVVTSWSWFGTNMLGVGLHSYGFMDAALFWLLVFVASQLLIIALANIPLDRWRSFSDTSPKPTTQPPKLGVQV